MVGWRCYCSEWKSCSIKKHWVTVWVGFFLFLFSFHRFSFHHFSFHFLHIFLWLHGTFFNNLLKNQNKKNSEIQENTWWIWTKMVYVTKAALQLMLSNQNSRLVACLHVHHPRHFFLFVWKICSWTNLFMMRSIYDLRFYCISLNEWLNI